MKFEPGGSREYLHLKFLFVKSAMISGPKFDATLESKNSKLLKVARLLIKTCCNFPAIFRMRAKKRVDLLADQNTLILSRNPKKTLQVRGWLLKVRELASISQSNLTERK
jgi:hypothetical protein